MLWAAFPAYAGTGSAERLRQRRVAGVDRRQQPVEGVIRVGPAVVGPAGAGGGEDLAI